MKVIDLLNKIAKGEIEHGYKFRYGNKIVTMEYLLDNYLFLEILNDEIEFIEDDIEEEKKIPEKLEEFGLIQYNLDYIDYKNIETLKEWLNKDFQTIYDTLDLIIKNQNKLIDYLKSKGE